MSDEVFPTMDGEARQSEEMHEETHDEQSMPLPPASFLFLILSMRAQCEIQLGLMNYGQEKQEPNLPVARHTIDLMAMLLEKTKGNLSLEEHRTLENSLTELRFRYVQVSDEVAKAAKA